MSTSPQFFHDRKQSWFPERLYGDVVFILYIRPWINTHKYYDFRVINIHICTSYDVNRRGTVPCLEPSPYGFSLSHPGCWLTYTPPKNHAVSSSVGMMKFRFEIQNSMVPKCSKPATSIQYLGTSHWKRKFLLGDFLQKNCQESVKL